MIKIWQMWSGGLAEETVNNIINICEQYPVSDSYLGFDGDTQNNKYRTSELRWVGDNVQLNKMMWDYGHEANRNAFGFDIDYLKEIQFTTYKGSENGKYDWHCDTFWGNPRTYDRKISVVIQLSDPSDYEGGMFEFDHQWEQPLKEDLMKKGTVIAFPSFIQHRVTPVTEGIRKSLVAWIEGPKFR
jgi:PKHD-type hydroxylase